MASALGRFPFVSRFSWLTFFSFSLFSGLLTLDSIRLLEVRRGKVLDMNIPDSSPILYFETLSVGSVVIKW